MENHNDCRSNIRDRIKIKEGELKLLTEDELEKISEEDRQDKLKNY